MSASILDKAISLHPFYPKSIKVGFQIRKYLAADHIKWKHSYIDGSIDSGINSPTLDEKIFAHVESELDDLGYELPKNP